MEEVLHSDDSGDSIVEVEIPKRPTPPLIYIEDDEILLNIVERKEESILAKDFIKNDQGLSVMPRNALSPQIINTPNHWTSDMIKFYDDDWGDEDEFIVEKLQEKMDKRPSLWEISLKDVSQVHSRSRRNNFKCWNCAQPGHNTSFCPEPLYIPKCHMCGIMGHVEFSCPDSKCLNCGNRSKEYVICCFRCKSQINGMCSRCRMIGHNFINCPDHWRLFHLTTGSTSVIIPDKNVYKSDKDLWCSNCGKQGHYQTFCIKRKDCGGFRDSLPFVISYQKAFNDNYLGSTQSGLFRKKNKRSKKNENRNENIFKKNLMNRVIRKDKVQSKNKYKRFKKWRKKNLKNDRKET